MGAGHSPLPPFHVVPFLLMGGFARIKLPVREKRVFMDNSSAPRPIRSGFLYPRYDARLHDGDEVQLESLRSTWLTVSFDPALMLQGRTLALQASNGKFCAVVQHDPHGRIRCDHDQLEFSSWIKVSRGTGNASLWSLHGRKYCIDEPHGVTCTGINASSSEAFGIANAGNGNIALRSVRNGKYCADQGQRLVCNHKELCNLVTFKPVTDTSLTPWIVQTQDRSAATSFVIHRKDLNDPRVALHCKGTQFYLAVDKISGVLGCSSPSPWNFSSSRVSWWDVKSVTFQDDKSGLYFRASEPKHGRTVLADSTEGIDTAVWKVLLVGGYESLRPLVRGVNLGNWFLLERWMASDLFYDETGQRAFEDQCAAIDEYGLMHALGEKVARKRMEQHWASWITEEDVRWLGSHGINTVRVPLGYWMVFPSSPFIDGQLKYLDKLFEWCERHSISVLLDFHGLKGSQTGSPSSGNCGACGKSQCGDTHISFLEERGTNLDVIDNLTSRYSDSPAYLGFAVANEVSSTADSVQTMNFSQTAYDIIRRKSKDALVILSATFNPSTYPFPNFRNVVEDIHIYFGKGFGHPTMDQHENLLHARNAVAGTNWHVLIGEWSLASNGHPTLSWEPSERDKFFERFAKMQLQAWETHSIGWFYWNYKTRFANSTWNFRDMCQVGWLPGCTKDIEYASAEWWNTPACAYAYLDGGCPPSPSMSSIWWVILLALVGAAVTALKPAWAVKCLGTAGLAAGSFADAAAVAVASAAASVTSWMPGHSGWQELGTLRTDSSPALPDGELLCGSHSSSEVPGRTEMSEQPFIW